MKHLSVRRAPKKRRVRTPPPMPRGSRRGLPSGTRFTLCPVCGKSVATSLLDSHLHTCLAYIESDREINGRLSQEGQKAEEVETEAVSHNKSGSEQKECWHDSATLTCASIEKRDSQHESPSHGDARRIAPQPSSRCNEEQEGRIDSGSAKPIHRTDSDSRVANGITATIAGTQVGSGWWTGKLLLKKKKKKKKNNNNNNNN